MSILLALGLLILILCIWYSASGNWVTLIALTAASVGILYALGELPMLDGSSAKSSKVTSMIPTNPVSATTTTPATEIMPVVTTDISTPATESTTEQTAYDNPNEEFVWNNNDAWQKTNTNTQSTYEPVSST